MRSRIAVTLPSITSVSATVGQRARWQEIDGNLLALPKRFQPVGFLWHFWPDCIQNHPHAVSKTLESGSKSSGKSLKTVPFVNVKGRIYLLRLTRSR